MLDKKQIQEIFFLFKFKMGHKAAEITHNIENASGPGTAKERTVQWWFKQFCKGDKTFENEALSGQLSEVDNDQFRGSLKLILLQLHKKLPRKSISAILWSFSIWSKYERWKSSMSGWAHELTENKKKITVLKCPLLLFYTTMNHFSIGSWHATKSGLYITTGNN